MKLRKLFPLILLALSGVAATHAQRVAVQAPRYTIEGDQLSLQAEVVASGLEVKGNDSYRLEIYIENNGQRLLLPAVVYTGAMRGRFDARREALSHEFILEPYHTYRKVSADQTYTLDYRVTLPYYLWMEHGTVRYRLLQYGCSGETAVMNGCLAEDLNYRWHARTELYEQMVSFLTPQAEEVKARTGSLTLNIGYPVNVYAVRPEFGENAKELQRVDSLMGAILGNPLVFVGGINIVGYASPEGSYDRNQLLAKGRANGFHDYLKGKYDLKGIQTNVLWIAEDWDGALRIANQKQIPLRGDLATVIRDTPSFEARKRILADIAGGALYRRLLDEIFPLLRRIELNVNYVVAPLSDSEARELIRTRPELLSLDEMFRVGAHYRNDIQQYSEVCKIAARQYPDDFIANHNAAAACLLSGDLGEAYPYLMKTQHDPRSYLNIGTYYYIMGDVERASGYFRRAAEAGITQGTSNLQLLSK